MFWKKKGREKSKSFSHTSTTVFRSVTVNGQAIELDEDVDVDHLVAQLQASGLPDDLVSKAVDSLQQVRANAQSQLTDRAQVKLDCPGCNRTVAFSKGSCIYCGAELVLPEETKTKAESVAKAIDAEILNSKPVEAEQTRAETEFINRLKGL